MPPNNIVSTELKHETITTDNFPKVGERKLEIFWRNVMLHSFVHLSSLYGLWLVFTSAKLSTTIFTLISYQLSCLGITMGAHRLWSHRAYKAKLPLRILLVALDTLAFQDSVIVWSKNHRAHHKFVDTDADPYNINRGFFFAHVGWVLCRKHPQVKEKGSKLDMSDLYSDPLLSFQHKYYFLMLPFISFVLPTWIPIYFFGETLENAFFLNLLRYCVSLNGIFLVNSAAHYWGNKPYDKGMTPTQTGLVSLAATGEGYHNFHHVFPFDYRTAELGTYSFNLACVCIDLFAKIGWAYDLRTVTDETIRNRMQRTGDGTEG